MSQSERVCPECGAQFTAPYSEIGNLASQQVYCREGCRLRAVNRKQREKKRAKREAK